MTEFAGQSVLVLGFGVSGRSAARYCAARGARVLVVDERTRESIGLDAPLPDGVEVRFGQAFPDLADFDLVVPSPGIPAARWQGRARRAWGDIELCYRALQVPIIAVTGTNGKSTVVRLIEAMARAAGLRARAAGNLGDPALELVDEALDLAILEVSSFQLESVERFRPRTAVWLNLSPDHFDRHGDLEGYRAAKARLFACQGEGDHAILNGDDPLVHALVLPPNVERLEFRRGRIARAAGPTIEDVALASAQDGAWLEGRNAIVRREGRRHAFDLDAAAQGASGVAHQDENVLAALLALASLESELEIDLAAAIGALADFRGLPHRCERIATRRGVTYYDDSKATNIGAAARSLEALPGPILWIAGGRHKGGDLSPLAASAAGRAKRALLIGEAAAEFERALADQVACERVGTLARAVERAAEIGRAGDSVLLAPACASFDQFQNFEDRGRQFQAAVRALDDGRSAA